MRFWNWIVFSSKHNILVHACIYQFPVYLSSGLFVFYMLSVTLKQIALRIKTQYPIYSSELVHGIDRLMMATIIRLKQHLVGNNELFSANQSELSM